MFPHVAGGVQTFLLGMNCVALPLSVLHVPLRLPPLVSRPAAAHLLLVGLPIAWITRQYVRHPL